MFRCVTKSFRQKEVKTAKFDRRHSITCPQKSGNTEVPKQCFIVNLGQIPILKIDEIFVKMNMLTIFVQIVNEIYLMHFSVKAFYSPILK